MNKDIDNYIDKQVSPQKDICQKLREIILKTLPEPDEKMKWGVASYLDGKIYFVALKKHVNIGFSIKELPEKELSLLQGSGKTMKHIEIHQFRDISINEELIIKLIKLMQN
jgi:hypothetical protein